MHVCQTYPGRKEELDVFEKWDFITGAPDFLQWACIAFVMFEVNKMVHFCI